MSTLSLTLDKLLSMLATKDSNPLIDSVIVDFQASLLVLSAKTV